MGKGGRGKRESLDRVERLFATGTDEKGVRAVLRGEGFTNSRISQLVKATRPAGSSAQVAESAEAGGAAAQRQAKCVARSEVEAAKLARLTAPAESAEADSLSSSESSRDSSGDPPEDRAAESAEAPLQTAEIAVPSWRHAKCAACKVKIGGSLCFTFEDTAGLKRAKVEDAKAREEKALEHQEQAREDLQRKRELKACDPAAYERERKRHRHGCACCEAWGTSWMEDFGDEEEDQDNQEAHDSLDEEERRLEDPHNGLFLAMAEEDPCDFGRRMRRFTWSVHPTARCLGAWRRPAWWGRYRARLPEAPAVAGVEKLSADGRQEFERVWGAILDGEAPAAVDEHDPGSDAGSPSHARGALSEEQFQAFQQRLAALSATKKPELIRMLMQNGIRGAHQLPKAHVAELVALNQALGVLSLCPKCKKGLLDFDRLSGKVSCRGHKVGKMGWRHCAGPEGLGLSWEQLGRESWEEGLAPPPQPRAKAQPRRRFDHPYVDFYDWFNPFHGDPSDDEYQSHFG